MTHARTLSVVIVGGCVLCAPPLAQAVTYHVSPAGCDTAPGSLAQPLRTIQHCADLAAPGDICTVHSGVYRETVRPTLSSLDPDSRRIGYEAAQLLAQKMAGKAAPEAIQIPPNRVAVRQSTDFIVIEDADVAQAVQFIRQNACLGIDVSHVVQEVGISRRALELKFQQHMGRAPKAEIRRVRIEHAKTLLARTEQTIKAIAQAIAKL